MREVCHDSLKHVTVAEPTCFTEDENILTLWARRGDASFDFATWFECGPFHLSRNSNKRIAADDE
jgi:hypothetical protein